MYSTRKIPTFWKIVLPVSSWKKETKHGTTNRDGGKGRTGTRGSVRANGSKENNVMDIGRGRAETGALNKPVGRGTV
jgi:hypothetical protein